MKLLRNIDAAKMTLPAVPNHCGHEQKKYKLLR